MVRIRVRVQPYASRSEVLEWDGEVLRVRVRAAAEQGRANAAVTELLARALDVTTSSVVLERGLKSRQKVIAITAPDEARVRERLDGMGAIRVGRRQPS